MTTRIRQAAKIVLPEPMVQRIQRKLAERADPPPTIDLDSIQLIRDARVEDLAKAGFLERELLPKLGLNNELMEQFPSSLHPSAGRGLLHWQYPNQFSKYLAELSQHRIESYLEIGVRRGGTFVITVEYLSRFHPVRKAVAVDIERTAVLPRYAKSRPGVSVMKADSQTEEFREFVRSNGPFDLVLIDGDHSEEGCRYDFDTVVDHARIMVFHDIVSDPVPGVGAVWRDVKAAYADRFEFLEFTDQYPELAEEGQRFLGIGVAVARPLDQS